MLLNREKLDEEKKMQMDNNYATPLAGTHLNLPTEPVAILCPSCGINQLTEVHVEEKKWSNTCNEIYSTLFYGLCCCLCFEYKKMVNRTDTNHYCKNCSCYLGRAKRVPPVKSHNGNHLSSKYAN
ncbi:uncharacterized protein [Musca autumnalis]|uniref:uncharacterized protein n=1 Tax=Musca autumnalis TaxID=221902 RepID=UPI003CEFDAF5